MATGIKERETHEHETRNANRTQDNPSDNPDTAVEQTGKQEATTLEGIERTRAGRIFIPAVDIYETNDAVVLVADMPGVDEQSVDVTLEKNVLTIYGHVEPHLPAGHTLTYAEYAFGDYQRSFTISNAIDWENIDGVVKDGVLKLTLPKAGPAKTTKIAIKSA